jgi:hypothetical protein
MPKLPEDSNPESWNRYFATLANNRAWELAGQPSRSPEETAEMLDAAHTASLHWNAVGTELNRMRAKTLVVQAHVLAGLGGVAWPLAEEVRSYFLARDTEDWEIALVHSIHAHAAACAGFQDAHRNSYGAARQALDAISDPEDRGIIQNTFDQVPIPAEEDR